MGNGCLTVYLAFWQWLAGMGIVAEPTEMADLLTGTSMAGFLAMGCLAEWVMSGCLAEWAYFISETF